MQCAPCSNRELSRWLTVIDLPPPEVPQTRVPMLEVMPAARGPSYRSAKTGEEEMRSQNRIPFCGAAERYGPSWPIKQQACSAKLSKVSFTGSSAALPGIPAHQIGGAPIDSSFTAASMAERPEATLF